MRWLARLPAYLFITLLILLLGPASVQIRTLPQRVDLLARPHAFDYTSWTVNALWIKFNQAALGSPHHFTPEAQRQMTLEYLDLVDELNRVNREIEILFADPNVGDPQLASQALRAEQAALTGRLADISPLVESALEYQISQVLDELGLTLGGQPLPFVLYHVTPLPQNLVVSRRDVIQQETSYLLNPDLTTEQAASLEGTIDSQLNVSTLVVPVGGIALYPTMVMRTSALDWLAEVIAHEWIHVYLAYKPLGANYSASPELRTMNETVASIAGKEIGRRVLELHYPEYSLPPLPRLAFRPVTQENAFDFRAEMHKTRLTADQLLAEGKIEEAETYMEMRRQFFWENGYAIRKLNQAYFAFYGAYADTPGGPAGEDPVGPAVREMRERSATLKEFLDIMAEMDSFEDLLAELEKTE